MADCKVFVALFVLCLNGVVGLGFSNRLIGPHPPKFAPTYVQTLLPLGRHVLTTHTVNQPTQDPPQQWLNILNDAQPRTTLIPSGDAPNVAYVVAYGPHAQDAFTANGRNWQGWVHEGEQVVVPACQRPVTSNLISNGAPARPQYCLYDISEIIAAYQEKPYGNNRRYPYTSRILLPNFRRGYLFNSV